MLFLRATSSLAARRWALRGSRFASSSSNQPPQPVPPAALPTLDFSPSEAEPVRTGAKSAKDSLSSIERRSRSAIRIGFGLFLFGLGTGSLYLSRHWEEAELKDKKKDPSAGPFARAGARFVDILDFFNKPAWPELLPPPLPEQYQKPHTLLLSIDDLLVTSTWDRQNGWRTAKRPGVDYFLGYLSQFYEIVIFTTQPYYTAMPITDKLDPFQYFITYQLFREATRSVGGKIIKDISYLNRDLARVIAIDTDRDHYANQPENAIILPKWKGDPKDQGLVGLIPFLESVAIHNAPDVRPILAAYNGKDIAIEYAKQEAEHKRRLVEEWEQKRKNMKGLSSGGFTLSGLFGGDPNHPNAPGQPPMTYLEQKRKMAQQFYKEEQAYLRAHEKDILKAKEDHQQQQMKEMQGSLLGLFSGKPPSKEQGPSKAGETETGKSVETLS